MRYLPLAQIEDSPQNPRRRLQGVGELSASLQAHGLLQPVVVRRVGDHYVLVAGHRRTEAARMLGWESIPATVRSEAADEAYLLTLVENLQRQDLSPREESAALEVLVRERGWNTRQVATAIERSPAFVSKRLRVFEDPAIGPAVLANKLSVSAAEELLSVPAQHRGDLLAQAILGNWDMTRVRQAVRIARFGPKQKAGGRGPPPRPPRPRPPASGPAHGAPNYSAAAVARVGPSATALAFQRAGDACSRATIH